MNDDEIVWYVYECPPQDWWDGWLTVKDYLTGAEDIDRAKTLLVTAQDAVRSASQWEGDGNWVCAGLPLGDYVSGVIFSVKQMDNGTTFFASPCP